MSRSDIVTPGVSCGDSISVVTLAPVGEPSSVSRWFRIAAWLSVAFIIVYAGEPFTFRSAPAFNLSALENPPVHISDQSVPLTAVTVVAQSHNCSAAVLDAWRAHTGPGEWFGYSPLAAVPVVLPGSCRTASRHRLRMAGIGVVVVVELLLAAWAIDRRRDAGKNPGPNAAI